MKILIIGDIFSLTGRKMIEKHLSSICQKLNIDFIIANGENITHGRSMSIKDYNFLKKHHVDVITGGNHTFNNKEIYSLLNKNDVLRPLNFNPYTPGKGSATFSVKNKTIRVTSLLGTTYMSPCMNPYYEFDKILKLDTSDINIVDFHTEATSEKIAFAINYDGKITALYGTHTHVMTNDDRILPHGTAFLTDVGMTGPYNSIIGMKPETIIHKNKTNLNQRHEIATGEGQFCAWYLDINESTNLVSSFEKIMITPDKYQFPLDKK